MTAISSRRAPATDHEPGFPAPLARMLTSDLAELDERALLGIVGSLSRDSERRAAACELLVSRYRWLVRSCVRRYLYSPEPAEDLMQVGYVGILLMDFFSGMPQTEIGRRLGISQMQVSRLRARALGYLRSRLLDLEEQAS